MPRFDGTGPIGQGAMTGGGRGYCVVELNDSGINPGSARGFYGRGLGRGYRNCVNAVGLPGLMRNQRGRKMFGGLNSVVSNGDELAMLKNQASYLKDELDAIQARVYDLEGKQQEIK